LLGHFLEFIIDPDSEAIKEATTVYDNRMGLEWIRMDFKGQVKILGRGTCDVPMVEEVGLFTF
jgi:hypothetical protein